MDYNTLLIVDDEEEVCARLALYFSHKHFRVSTAQSGEEAIELVRLHEPGVVITDYLMPGMNGIELLDSIKKFNPRIQVIFISGHADMKVAVRALKEEAFDFLAKPFEPDELFDVVKQAVNRAHQLEVDRDIYKGRALTHEVFETPGNISVLYCKVSLNENNGLRISQELNKFIEQGALCDRVVLSLAGVDHINNVGLNLLVEHVRLLEERGKHVVLTQIPVGVLNYLKILGYHEFFKIASTLDIAMNLV